MENIQLKRVVSPSLAYGEVKDNFIGSADYTVKRQRSSHTSEFDEGHFIQEKTLVSRVTSHQLLHEYRSLP